MFMIKCKRTGLYYHPRNGFHVKGKMYRLKHHAEYGLTYHIKTCQRMNKTANRANYEIIEVNNERIITALDIAYLYAQIDGTHHKAWVIDQMIRALTGSKYKQWVSDYCNDEDGANTYEWDIGIPP